MPRPRPICIKAQRQTGRRIGRERAFSSSLSFSACLLFLPEDNRRAYENKTHCSRHRIVSRPTSSTRRRAKCIFPFGTMPPFTRPRVFHVYVYGRGYGPLVPFLLCYTLIQRPGFPAIYAYTHVTLRQRIVTNEFVPGILPVFSLSHHVPRYDASIKVDFLRAYAWYNGQWSKTVRANRNPYFTIDVSYVTYPIIQLRSANHETGLIGHNYIQMIQSAKL